MRFVATSGPSATERLTHAPIETIVGGAARPSHLARIRFVLSHGPGDFAEAVLGPRAFAFRRPVHYEP